MSGVRAYPFLAVHFLEKIACLIANFKPCNSTRAPTDAHLQIMPRVNSTVVQLPPSTRNAAVGAPCHEVPALVTSQA